MNEKGSMKYVPKQEKPTNLLYRISWWQDIENAVRFGDTKMKSIAETVKVW